MGKRCRRVSVRYLGGLLLLALGLGILLACILPYGALCLGLLLVCGGGWLLWGR